MSTRAESLNDETRSVRVIRGGATPLREATEKHQAKEELMKRIGNVHSLMGHIEEEFKSIRLLALKV